MTVFIVTWSVDYSDSEIIQVFSRLKDAKAKIVELAKQGNARARAYDKSIRRQYCVTKNGLAANGHGDSFNIETWEVTGPSFGSSAAGKIGGKARATKLTAVKRSIIARNAALARWRK